MLNKFFESPYFPIISDYAKILIPSFLTYLFAKYKFSNDKKHEIYEKQFAQVYLPLYLLTKQYLKDTELPAYDLYIRKVDKLFYRNYVFVFPKTLKLFAKFKCEVQTGHMSPYLISLFEYQVSSDYNKLKAQLGYPTDSFFDFFKRLNTLDKCMYIVFSVLSLFALIMLTQTFLTFLAGDIFEFTLSILTTCTLLLMLYGISYLMSH